VSENRENVNYRIVWFVNETVQKCPLPILDPVSVPGRSPATAPATRLTSTPKIFDALLLRQRSRTRTVGLSKAWRIVTLHGGTIDVRETPGGLGWRPKSTSPAKDSIGSVHSAAQLTGNFVDRSNRRLARDVLRRGFCKQIANHPSSSSETLL
jgi:hypothetical protein